MREKYQLEIENYIDKLAEGSSFTAIDFKDIADTDPTNKALSRLLEEGKIRRVIQGVYDKPAYSPLINEYSAPNIIDIAYTLARKFNWTISPAGETALNYLHLSNQVSNSFDFISDGPYRKYCIDPYFIEFKHCANKEISNRSNITILVIQALKYLGQNNISNKELEILSNVLSDEEKIIILKESKTTTSWINKLIREICKNGQDNII